MCLATETMTGVQKTCDCGRTHVDVLDDRDRGGARRISVLKHTCEHKGLSTRGATVGDPHGTPVLPGGKKGALPTLVLMKGSR